MTQNGSSYFIDSVVFFACFHILFSKIQIFKIPPELIVLTARGMHYPSSSLVSIPSFSLAYCIAIDYSVYTSWIILCNIGEIPFFQINCILPSFFLTHSDLYSRRSQYRKYIQVGYFISFTPLLSFEAHVFIIHNVNVVDLESWDNMRELGFFHFISTLRASFYLFISCPECLRVKTISLVRVLLIVRCFLCNYFCWWSNWTRVWMRVFCFFLCIIEHWPLSGG